jgi:hypothetical protein
LSTYVQEDGTLANDPVFQPSEAWDTVLVATPEIIPAMSYDFQVEVVGTDGLARSASSRVTTWLWGDVDNNGRISFTDIALVVEAFRGNFVNVTREAADLKPCTPNRIVNFNDISACTDAFRSHGYTDSECSSPCP